MNESESESEHMCEAEQEERLSVSLSLFLKVGTNTQRLAEPAQGLLHNDKDEEGKNWFLDARDEQV